MAPHDDFRSAPHEDDLSSLYQQRKRRHPAPERLNEAVLATAKADKKGQGAVMAGKARCLQRQQPWLFWCWV